jgi:hypothetical protein
MYEAALLNWPASHWEQAEDTEEEYLPAGQISHTCWPPDENLPARQIVQVEEVVEICARPAAQRVHVSAPAALYWPTAHLVQREEDNCPLNFPAGHSMQFEYPM